MDPGAELRSDSRSRSCRSPCCCERSIPKRLLLPFAGPDCSSCSRLASRWPGSFKWMLAARPPRWAADFTPWAGSSCSLDTCRPARPGTGAFADDPPLATAFRLPRSRPRALLPGRHHLFLCFFVGPQRLASNRYRARGLVQRSAVPFFIWIGLSARRAYHLLGLAQSPPGVAHQLRHVPTSRSGASARSSPRHRSPEHADGAQAVAAAAEVGGPVTIIQAPPAAIPVSASPPEEVALVDVAAVQLRSMDVEEPGARPKCSTIRPS